MIVKKNSTIILSLFWTCYFVFQLCVWNSTIRTGFFSVNAVVDMAASFLNDLVWIPIALALPVYVAAAFSAVTGKPGKIIMIVLAFTVLLLGISHLLIFFRYLFILIFVFFVAIVLLMKQDRFSFHHAAFAVVLLTLVIYYNSQLVPRIRLFEKESKNELTVMSCNIGWDLPNDSHERFAQLLTEQKPDIVCIQEFSTKQRQYLYSALEDIYPYQNWSNTTTDYGGGAILSQIPFEHKEVMKITSLYFEKKPATITRSVISIDGKKIDIFNCHLYHSANYILERIYDGKKISFYYRKAQIGYMRHRDEAARLAAKIFPVDRPVILTGDFNDTPNSWVYELFDDKLKNGFATAGWGLGTTYGEYSLKQRAPHELSFLIIDVLRIDHIFCSRQFEIKKAHVLPFSDTDHKPQTVQLLIR